MMQPNRTRQNGEEGNVAPGGSISPGRRLPQLQSTFDRHPVNGMLLTREKTYRNMECSNQRGKLACTLGEPSRLEIDILGMAEVRWTKSGNCITDDHVLIHTGHKTNTNME